MLRDFLKERNEPRSERQPFLDFVAAEAKKLPDEKYDLFQAEVFNLLQGPSGQMHLVNRVNHPPRSISD